MRGSYKLPMLCSSDTDVDDMNCVLLIMFLCGLQLFIQSFRLNFRDHVLNVLPCMPHVGNQHLFETRFVNAISSFRRVRKTFHY